jgi:transposase-like protein
VTPYESEEQAKRDALCRPLSIAEVMRRTGHSKRTIERWVEGGKLTKYELDNPREIVYLAREVLETEKEMHERDEENRERIRRLAGRRGPSGEGIDSSPPDVAS